MNVAGASPVAQAYHLAIGQYTRRVRTLLPAFDGYECKEPEPGKFTLAFRCASCTSLLPPTVRNDIITRLLHVSSPPAAPPPFAPPRCCAPSVHNRSSIRLLQMAV